MEKKTGLSPAKSRNICFDILKIICVMAVVLIHSSSKAVEDATVFACPDFFFANIFNAVSRFGVPIFVMISGALMLDENKILPTKLIYSKYIKSIVYVFVFWSVLFTFVFAYQVPMNKGWTIHFDKVLTYFLQGHYHLWYLFMIVGLYISTPILRQFVRKNNEKTVVYFLKAGFIAQGVVPFILQLLKTFADINLTETLELFSLDTFLGFAFYYVLGWYLSNFTLKDKTQKIIYILGIISIVFSILFTYFVSVDQGKAFIITYRNFYFNNVLYASAIFLFFKKRFGQKSFSENKSRIITKLSSLTFGIYIVHPFVIEALRTSFGKITPQPLSILLMWLTVTVVTAFICFVLSKIPGIKKLIKS